MSDTPKTDVLLKLCKDSPESALQMILDLRRRLVETQLMKKVAVDANERLEKEKQELVEAVGYALRLDGYPSEKWEEHNALYFKHTNTE